MDSQDSREGVMPSRATLNATLVNSIQKQADNVQEILQRHVTNLEMTWNEKSENLDKMRKTEIMMIQAATERHEKATREQHGYLEQAVYAVKSVIQEGQEKHTKTFEATIARHEEILRSAAHQQQTTLGKSSKEQDSCLKDALQIQEEHQQLAIGKQEQKLQDAIVTQESCLLTATKKQEDKINKTLSQHEQNLIEVLRVREEKYDASLKEQKECLAQSLMKQEDKFKDFLENHKHALERASEQQKESLDEALQKQREHLEESVEKQESSFKKSLQQQDKRLEQALDKQDRNMKDLQQRSEKSLKDTLQRQEESFQRLLDIQEADANQALKKLEQEIGYITRERKHLQQVAATEDENRQLKTELDETKLEKGHLQNSVTSLETKITELETDLTDCNDNLKDKEKDIERLKKELKESQELSKMQTKLLDDANKQISLKAVQMLQMQGAIVQLQVNVQQQNKELKIRLKEIADLQENAQQQQKLMQQQQLEIIQTKQVLQVMEQNLLDSAKNIEVLEQTEMFLKQKLEYTEEVNNELNMKIKEIMEEKEELENDLRMSSEDNEYLMNVLQREQNSPSGDQLVPLKRPVLELDVLPPSGLTEVTTLVSLLDGGAILASKEGTEHQIVRVDRRGKPISPCHTCWEDSLVQGLIVTQKYLYALQSNGTVTKSYIQDLQETVETYNIGTVGSLCFGALTSVNELVLPDYEWGEVFSYNFDKKLKRTCVSSLDKPVSVAYHRVQKLYAVCEYWGNCVNLYDSLWNKRTTIGGPRGDEDGELYSPSCAIFTPSGTLYIADKYNDRVSEFYQDGRFVRHVITARDGIKEPISLSLTFPHIWVTCNYGNNVKRFKIFES